RPCADLVLLHPVVIGFQRTLPAHSESGIFSGHSSDTLIFVLRGCATGVEKPRMRGSSIIQLHTSRLEKITTPPADTPTAPLCPAPHCFTEDFIQCKFWL